MSDPPPTLAQRYRGTLLGLACGDAIGASTEGLEPGRFEPLTDLRGGGPHRLLPGQWTEDTSLAMCLAESLVACPRFDALDQMSRYRDWFRCGYWSSRADAVGIGPTTERALLRFEADGDPWCGVDTVGPAGCGALARAAAVALRYHPSQPLVRHHAAQSARTTHGSDLAAEGAALLAHALSRLLDGASKEDFLDGAAGVVSDARLRPAASGAFRGRAPTAMPRPMTMVDALEAGLWAFASTGHFRQAVLRAANLGGVASTSAAIAGLLAGAHQGAPAIPGAWLSRLYRRKDIDVLGVALLMEAAGDESLAPPEPGAGRDELTPRRPPTPR